METEPAEIRVLDAAETLFDERGVQAVGMDAIRTASGVSLKRLYQAYPSKVELLEAVLRRRDEAVTAGIENYVAARSDPRARVLAVFDFLADWFADPAFRGCVFINTYGEMGGISESVAALAREHKLGLRSRLAGLLAETDVPPAATESLATQLALLADGAMVTAALTGTRDAAQQAKAAAGLLLDAATT
ncbi:TetR/AcrR family transcriptional regulator (plasmid) [Streptomyces sp. CA-294286]|uniref:TetR/AcrR family transcriptional regulator n=1 Tax=Streptomyces sp. CA-294286 TaxID=3240070 RepID=UPI003D8E2EEE